MKLKFLGTGYMATIEPTVDGDFGIDLSVFNANGTNHLVIERDIDEQITLTRDEAIALRNYLNQICPTL